MQSVAITTKVVSLNPAHAKVYWIQHYVIKFIIDLWQVCGFLKVLPISSTNKTDRHDIAELLMKVVLSTITLTVYFLFLFNLLDIVSFYFYSVYWTLCLQPIRIVMSS